MRRIALALLAAAFLTACGTTSNHHVQPVAHRSARVTYYHKSEDRRNGSRIAMTSHFRALEGRTMAAPSVVPFRASVLVPQLNGIVGNGQFTIEDRGSALEKAYRQGELRLDIYVASRKKMNWCKAHLPEVMAVIMQ
jgi:hypothetical protein